MLISCNSCQKKFIVPDNEIKEYGRLVQCSACGNKWTQFPTKKSSDQIVKRKVQKKPSVKKNLYTPEYLRKKHGLVIESPKNIKENNNKNKINSGLGFYGYTIILIVFFLSMFAVLNLIKDMLMFNFPASKMYINYFYETIEFIKVFFLEFIN